MRDTSLGPRAYWNLFALQTAAASSLFWVILPVFRRMVSRLGQPQDLETWRLLVVAISVTVIECCYWLRLRCVPIHVPFQNMFVGHVVMFASRVSFFFGGAFFSVVFFRHLPELDALPPIGQGSVKALAIMAILFSLFCYALELERLGKAIERETNASTDQRSLSRNNNK